MNAKPVKMLSGEEPQKLTSTRSKRNLGRHPLLKIEASLPNRRKSVLIGAVETVTAVLGTDAISLMQGRKVVVREPVISAKEKEMAKERDEEKEKARAKAKDAEDEAELKETHQ